MNLTLYDLESLKTQCDNLSKLIKEIKSSYNPTNTQRQLFVSRDDYYESLKIKKQTPQKKHTIERYASVGIKWAISGN